jgi:hypothetical protein
VAGVHPRPVGEAQAPWERCPRTPRTLFLLVRQPALGTFAGPCHANAVQVRAVYEYFFLVTARDGSPFACKFFHNTFDYKRLNRFVPKEISDFQ